MGQSVSVGHFDYNDCLWIVIGQKSQMAAWNPKFRLETEDYPTSDAIALPKYGDNASIWIAAIKAGNLNCKLGFGIPCLSQIIGATLYSDRSAATFVVGVATGDLHVGDEGVLLFSMFGVTLASATIERGSQHRYLMRSLSPYPGCMRCPGGDTIVGHGLSSWLPQIEQAVKTHHRYLDNLRPIGRVRLAYREK